MLVPETLFGLIGRRVLLVEGLFSATVSSVLLGRMLTGAQGSFGYQFSLTLAGRSCVPLGGIFGTEYDCHLFPSGVWATGMVGVFPTSTNAPLPKARELLWSQATVENLFVVADDTKNKADAKSTFVVIEPME